MCSPLKASVLVLAVALVTAACKRPRPIPREDPEAPASISTPAPPRPLPTPPRADPSSPIVPAGAYEVADPAHVDPQELAAQARALAVRTDPHAVLMGISTSGDLVNGTLDLTARGAVTFTFEYLYFDKTKPPGKDKTEGALWVRAAGGRFTVTHLDHAMQLGRPVHRPSPAPDPRCRLRDAWSAAVKSGVPSNTVASASYRESWPPGEGRPYAWAFRVDGHQELEREIDGATCAVVSGGRVSARHGAGAPVLDPAGAPAAAATAPGPCGCAAADLLCWQRCNGQRAKVAPTSPTDIR